MMSIVVNKDSLHVGCVKNSLLSNLKINNYAMFLTKFLHVI